MRLLFLSSGVSDACILLVHFTELTRWLHYNRGTLHHCLTTLRFYELLVSSFCCLSLLALLLAVLFLFVCLFHEVGLCRYGCCSFISYSHWGWIWACRFSYLMSCALFVKALSFLLWLSDWNVFVIIYQVFLFVTVNSQRSLSLFLCLFDCGLASCLFLCLCVCVFVGLLVCLFQ